MKVLFFISHQPNPRFIKQINFLAKDNDITVAFFERKILANLNNSISKKTTLFNLGEIPNASKPIKRLLGYFKGIGKVKKVIKHSDYDVVLMNNIDVLMLYILSRFTFIKRVSHPKIVIEISDLREFVFRKTFASKIIRLIERKLYQKHVNKLIVTSKKYYSYHFEKFFKKDMFVLENKLLSNEINITKPITREDSTKSIIGVIGSLVRKEEYIKLFETYKNSSDVEIHIHGKGQFQHIAEEYAGLYSNIAFFGPYNAFNDAQKIYQSVDIVYLVYDSGLVSLNNKLALPNKLYECMCFKVPIICSKDTYLEELVLDYGIGISINYKEPNAIERAVENLKINAKRIEKNFSDLSKRSFFGDQDYQELEAFLKK